MISRLNLLRQKLRRDPAELRRYSTHFERIDESLSDPRAKHIYRKDAIHGHGDADESKG